MSEGSAHQLPTREEELAYLDQLEASLRNPKRNGSEIPPRPTREFEYFVRGQQKKDSFRYWSAFTFWGFVGAPVACWLALKAPSKVKSLIGIPYQRYESQHKVRFWGYFALFDFLIANYGGQRNRDWNEIMNKQYQLLDMRTIKL